MVIMSFIVFFNPPKFRITYASPATVCWYSLMLFIDCVHLLFALALYQGHIKEYVWIFGGLPLTFVTYIKGFLYFVSFVSLLANPVADEVGAITALIGFLVTLSILATRYYYFENVRSVEPSFPKEETE